MKKSVPVQITLMSKNFLLILLILLMVKALANLNTETFNAAGGTVTLRGVSVHTGTAKGIMINCAKLAMQFDALLPGAAVPEHTCTVAKVSLCS